MSENRYVEVDPYAVAVSDMNERRDSPVTSSIQESIEQQGVIQPPLVRERDGPDSAEVPYEVVVGQRRVLGAQATASVETIPVVVVGWDDAEALEASITENINAFSEDVSPKDRAEAVLRLIKKRGYNQKQLAESLSVSPSLVAKWVERGREGWEGTVVDPTHDDQQSDSVKTSATVREVDKIDDGSLQHIRMATGGGEVGEEMAAAVAENGLHTGEVQEASKRVRRGEDPQVAVEQVAAEKGKAEQSTHKRTKAEITFSGDEAEALTTAAKQWGATENQVARQVILRYLDTEGFLADVGGDGS